VFLEHIWLCGRILTTDESIDRFISAQQVAGANSDAVEAPPNQPARTPGQRTRASETAAKKLEDSGL
jgi:hypothetical protein